MTRDIPAAPRSGAVVMPPVITIQGYDFNMSWEKAIQMCIKQGTPLLFGDLRSPKRAVEIVGTIVMGPSALQQIEKGEVHAKAPFKGRQLEEYCNEYTDEYLIKHDKLHKEDQHPYLYYDRLTRYDVFTEKYDGDYEIEWMNQLKTMKDQLKEQIESNISSNRSQAITWYPDLDNETTSPPCLQRIWVKYLGNFIVDVHLSWRSRDLFCAWQSNVVALVDMLYRDVLDTNGCKIARLVDQSDSLHIYEPDLKTAKEIVLNPMLH